MDEMMQEMFTEDQVAFLTVLDDLGQPHTCDSWGSHGQVDYPYIIDDGQSYYIYELFYPNTNIDYPKNIIVYSGAAHSLSSLDSLIHSKWKRTLKPSGYFPP